jgi:hypothetical protein
MTDLLLLLDVDIEVAPTMMRLSSARMFSLPRLNWPDAM